MNKDVTTKGTKNKAYPKYKPSGVEWLGDVPEHWGVKRLKFIGTSLIGLTYSPDDVVDEDYQGEKHLVLRSTNIQDGRITLHENVYVTTRVSKELKVRKWDILICARNGSRHLVGKNALINETDDNMTFGAFTTVFRSKINSFLFYYFASNQFQYQSTGFLTTTINQLTNGNLNSIITTLPPLPEQQAIAAFLDRETGRIDSLIAKKQRLLELLAEQRTALISRAVTKGLDAKVKLKPSGVEWLGDVPEHWGVKRLKTSVNYWVSNVNKVPDENELPVRLCNYTDVYYNDFVSSDMELMETTATIEEIQKFHLEVGDVVITKDSEEWNDIAISSLVIKTESNMVCGYHLAMIRPTIGKLIGKYLVRQFQSSAINHQFQLAATGVTRYGLPKSAIGEAIIPLPPLPEQQAIAAFLDRETAKIDTLSAKVITVIERLKEYRTALISSAVTGKIDVRGKE